ncbi:MAG TPA: DUF2490 domain-containing protein [Spirochaetota bacterium]|nr:DUF2490 domain-containing protein [Spirochaetota bacterium]
MFKKLCKLTIVLLLAVMVSGVFAGNAFAEKKQYTGRTWEYVNFTALLSPNWAFVVMPGHRYEYYRHDKSKIKDGEHTLQTFMYELFVGPVYIKKFDKLTFKLPVWYYYMGFDFSNLALGPDNDFGYLYSHNIEVLPIFEYKLGKATLVSRTIFHNKVYAHSKFYDEAKDKKGYSLLLRQLLRINYPLTESIVFTIADEVFYGLVEDDGTNDADDNAAPFKLVGEPFYAQESFNKNRLYTGFVFKFTPFISLSTQYIYETNYIVDDDYKLKDRNHYAQFTLNYVMKLY